MKPKEKKVDENEISEDEALESLRALITYRVKIKDLAKRFSVSNAQMSLVLQGKQKMTDEMLKVIGVQMVTVYIRQPTKVAKAA